MVWIGLGIVGGILIGYFIKRYMIHLEVKSLREQLQTIQDNKFRQTELSVSMGSSELVSLMNDLNDLINEQRIILENQQLQEGQLLEDIANISHDLRTPLTALYGYLELLDGPDLTPKERQYYLEIALARAEVLQRLIQNLFYLTRLEAQSIELKKDVLQIDQLLKEQAVMFYKDFRKQDITLNLNIEDIPTVISDEDAVNRILSNLFNNILEHGIKSASIEIFEQNGKAVTRFSNEITEEDTINADQVFDRHYMSKENRNTSNSGLGLTISHELIKQLGHKIMVDISDNEFTVTIHWL